MHARWGRLFKRHMLHITRVRMKRSGWRRIRGWKDGGGGCVVAAAVVVVDWCAIAFADSQAQKRHKGWGNARLPWAKWVELESN